MNEQNEHLVVALAWLVIAVVLAICVVVVIAGSWQVIQALTS